MCRHDVTDAEWNAIRVFLPKQRSGKAGRPWVSHRMVINGILWVLHVGGSWRDVPARYGNWSTVYNRFQRWCREGLWDRMMKTLLQKLDAAGGIDRSLWCIDGTIIRAHRCAAGALHSRRENPDNEALGRSQGGFGTKLHILTDGRGIPIQLLLLGNLAFRTYCRWILTGHSSRCLDPRTKVSAGGSQDIVESNGDFLRSRRDVIGPKRQFTWHSFFDR